MQTLTQYPVVHASNLGTHATKDVSVLTVNNRLARRLVQLLAQQQAAITEHLQGVRDVNETSQAYMMQQSQVMGLVVQGLAGLLNNGTAWSCRRWR